MDDKAEELYKLTQDIFACANDGVIFYPSAVKTIEQAIANLEAVLKIEKDGMYMVGYPPETYEEEAHQLLSFFINYYKLKK